jgi:hypothetical protein
VVVRINTYELCGEIPSKLIEGYGRVYSENLANTTLDACNVV